MGIAWSWKRRKVSDTIATDTTFSNPYHAAQISGSSAVQNSSSQSGIANQDQEVTCLQRKILNSNLNPQERNVVVETTSQSNPSTADNRLTEGCNKSGLTALTTSNIVSVPKQHFSNRRSDLTKSLLMAPGENARCETRALKEHILKKPKQEPVEFCQKQLPGNQPESILAPELQWKNNLLHQENVAEKLRGENFQDESNSLLTNSGFQRLLAGMPTFSVKQEPAETSFCGSDVRKITGNFVMDRRIGQYILQQSEKQPPLPRLRANAQALPNYSLCNQVAQVNESLRNESATHKRKALQNPQATTVLRSATISSQHNDYLAKKASVPAKQKTNSQFKGLNIKVVDSSASARNLNAVNGSNHPVGNVPLLKPSQIEVNPVLERFLKIEGVTRRYGHNYCWIKIFSICSEMKRVHVLLKILMQDFNA